MRGWEHPKRYPLELYTQSGPLGLVWPSVIDDDDDTLHDVKITAAPSVAALVVGGKIYCPQSISGGGLYSK